MEQAVAEDREVARALRIERTIPDGFRSVFANHFVVQHSTGGEVHLSCFEVIPPLILAETAKERDELLAKTGSVEARCVARIVTTVDRLQELLGVIVEGLNKYESYKQKESLAAAKSSGGVA
jgi:hypothetical protein